MATFSSRLGLTKPLGTEARSVVPLNANADAIDAFMPCILVNDGVIPPTAALYDGAIVREKTSGKTWEARKNGGGTFDVMWIVYPWHARCANTGPVLGSGTALQNIGVGSFVSGLNATAAVIVNSPGRVQVPVSGVYVMKSITVWGISGTGTRTSTFSINGVTPMTDLEVSCIPSTTNNTRQINTEVRALVANDDVGVWGWQSSGGALAGDVNFSIGLLQPRT